MVSIAFHATDANGGRDVALLDLQSRNPVGPWWMTGQNGFYAMSGKDAQGSPGTGTADNLIMLTMDQGGDINWAAVSVKLAIDGAAPVTADNPGVEGHLRLQSCRVRKHETPSLVRGRWRDGG
ncbi:MAG: hypothetical protein CM15mP78_12970 [Candidatus Poseidoniales archaeon]|nr:MAG: hypothetical protein CM15mP78_12970 [Candidatus Poseidoniales archaeon]